MCKIQKVSGDCEKINHTDDPAVCHTRTHTHTQKQRQNALIRTWSPPLDQFGSLLSCFRRVQPDCPAQNDTDRNDLDSLRDTEVAVSDPDASVPAQEDPDDGIVTDDRDRDRVRQLCQTEEREANSSNRDEESRWRHDLQDCTSEDT